LKEIANVGVAGSSPVSCSSIREPLRGVTRRGFSLVAAVRGLVPPGGDLTLDTGMQEGREFK
jgi:hypothetical protein